MPCLSYISAPPSNESSIATPECCNDFTSIFFSGRGRSVGVDVRSGFPRVHARRPLNDEIRTEIGPSVNRSQDPSSSWPDLTEAVVLSLPNIHNFNLLLISIQVRKHHLHFCCDFFFLSIFSCDWGRRRLILDGSQEPYQNLCEDGRSIPNIDDCPVLGCKQHRHFVLPRESYMNSMRSLNKENPIFCIMPNGSDSTLGIWDFFFVFVFCLILMTNFHLVQVKRS